MGLNRTDQPVVVGGTVGGAVSLAVTTGVGMVAELCGCLTAQQAAAVIGFANAVIAVGTIVWQYRNAWSTSTVERVAEVAAVTGDAQAAVESHK